MAGFFIDASEVTELLKELDDMPNTVMSEVYPYLKQQTPIRSGNARNRTKLKGTTINSNYGYAGRLDEGWSKQAPNGFTAPTEVQIDKEITQYIRGL